MEGIYQILLLSAETSRRCGLADVMVFLKTDCQIECLRKAYRGMFVYKHTHTDTQRQREREKESQRETETERNSRDSRNNWHTFAIQV